MRIGFLGLGAMGGGMARRLLSQGFSVRGFDLNPSRAAELTPEGLIPAASPQEAATDVDCVLSSLPDAAAVKSCYLGDPGVLPALRPGMVLMDLSTILPSDWRAVADRVAPLGVDVLCSPVSGGPPMAANGQLTLFVGGESAVVERMQPVLSALGSTVHHVGNLESGYVVKLVNNVMALSNVLVAAEAMVLGTKGGIDPAKLYEVICTSGGRSFHFERRFPRVLDGDFAPGFSIALTVKDLTLALEMARESGVPMLATSVVRELYRVAVTRGYQGLDEVGVIRVFEEWAGVQVRRLANP